MSSKAAGCSAALLCRCLAPFAAEAILGYFNERETFDRSSFDGAFQTALSLRGDLA